MSYVTIIMDDWPNEVKYSYECQQKLLFKCNKIDSKLFPWWYSNTEPCISNNFSISITNITYIVVASNFVLSHLRWTTQWTHNSYLA